METQDWPTLLVLCRDFYNSVNPKGPPKRGRDPESEKMSEEERTAHHKKIRSWFLNPSRYKSAIEAEQRKHNGKCIYHLSKTHPTSQGDVKKECDKLLLAKNSSGGNQRTSQTTQGQHCPTLVLRYRSEVGLLLEKIT